MQTEAINAFMKPTNQFLSRVGACYDIRNKNLQILDTLLDQLVTEIQELLPGWGN